MALAPDAGMAVWYGITGEDVGDGSHWLKFERGYDYGDVGRLIDRGASGESELNPLYVGAYGEGTDPTISSTMNIFQSRSDNIVVDGLDFENGVQILGGDNILLNNISVTGDEVNIQHVNGFTLRESDITDVAHDAPVNSGDRMS